MDHRKLVEIVSSFTSDRVTVENVLFVVQNRLMKVKTQDSDSVIKELKLC